MLSLSIPIQTCIMKASQTIIPLLSSCLLVSLLFRTTDAAPVSFLCGDDKNYTQGSPYESNLKSILNSLASNIIPSGLYTTTSGTSPNMVYGLLQCRGSISDEDCQSCANTSLVEIVNQCPNKKEAVIYYESCMWHYADSHFLGKADDRLRILYNVENASNQDVFDNQLDDLLDRLSTKASSDPRRFSSGKNLSENPRIYGMLQCTRDLSKSNCLSCLEYVRSKLLKEKIGGVYLTPTCFIRYETYPFFGLSASSIPDSSPPPATTAEGNSTNIPTNGGAGKGNNVRKVLLATLIPFVVISIFVATICALLCRRKSVRRKNGRGGQEQWMNPESLMFDLSSLRTATDDFLEQNKLGEGGFGSVYKGNLPDGRDIAVKRLSLKSGQGLEELKTEVVLVAKLLHRNLVRLLGFCLQEEEKLLVYEYLPNGSLDKILFDQSRRLLLDWDKRYKIIVGIARGLLYLHEDSQLRIIHRDLKASNVLLDEDMTAKISDFGLARLFAESQAQVKTSHIAGTYGYMAPEYIANGHFSTKSDVFSFGVLLLEIVAGRKNSSFQSGNLQSYAWRHWTNETALVIVDASLGEKYVPRDALKCIQLGLLCVQEAAIDRPTMSQVVLMLSSQSVTCPVPSQPAYFFNRMGTRSDVSDSSGILASDTGSLVSANEMTATEIFPR